MPSDAVFLISCYYLLWVLSLGFIAFTGYLFLYHTLLIVTNQTTWEHMSRHRITYLKYLPAGYNPFSEGIIKNVVDFYRKKQIGRNYRECIVSFIDAEELEVGCNVLEDKYYNCC